jgi:lipoprotein-releasing system permease protein
MVALRFLGEGFTQTLFIVGGVAIGVAVIVFMSALLTGLQANFVGRVLTGQPHLQLLPRKEALRPLRSTDAGVQGVVLQAAPQRVKGIDQWQGVVAHVKASPEVNVVSPVVNGSALALRGEVSRAITVAGIEPDTYFQVVPIPQKIVQGGARLTASDILVGTELAADLGVSVGDRLRIATAAGAGVTLTITGIFDLGSKPANARTTFVALRSAQSLLGLPGGVSSIDITLHDVYQAETLAQRIARTADVQADSWIRTNEQFFSAVQAQTSANTAIRFFVALSVAFGIASVLVVSVVQRSREIGILRAMGISRVQVMRVFLLQGGLLGLGGGPGRHCPGRGRIAAVPHIPAQPGRHAAVSHRGGARSVLAVVAPRHSHRPGGGAGARVACGAARPRGGDPWLTPHSRPARRSSNCGESASHSTSASRTRPRCCTVSTCRCIAANSAP